MSKSELLVDSIRVYRLIADQPYITFTEISATIGRDAGPAINDLCQRGAVTADRVMGATVYLTSARARYNAALQAVQAVGL